MADPELQSLLVVAQRLRAGVGIRDRWYHYSLYPDVFVGSEAVTWFVETGCVSNRAEGVALGQKLLEANFFHHVVDEHRFMDKELFYRFFVDEDKRFKHFWRTSSHRTRTLSGSVRDPGRWRFQPHTVLNSCLVNVSVAEGLQLAYSRSDHVKFMYYLREFQRSAKAATLDASGWRVSKSRTTADVTVYVQSNPYDAGVRKVKSVVVLPMPVADVVAVLASNAQRPRWDASHTGVCGIVHRLHHMTRCSGTPCACDAPLASKPPIASCLTLDDTGAGGDSDEELLHERMARFISRSNLLSHVFSGVVKRTENSQQYLDMDTLAFYAEPDVPEFPRIVYRQIRSVTALASTRDVIVFQDACSFPDGAHIVYEVSVQHGLLPPSSSCVRGQVLGLSYVVEPVVVSTTDQLTPVEGASPAHTPSSCRLTLFAHIAFNGRVPKYAEDAILTKNSTSAISKIRKTLLPTVPDVMTFENVPMADGSDLPQSPSTLSDLVVSTVAASSPHASPTLRRSSSASSRPAGKVSLQDFEILAVIGRGGYGKVFQVRRKGSAEVFAMKSLKKKDILARKQATRTMTERNILSSIEHPFIVNLKYAFQTPSKLFMVMDFVGGGDFFSMLSREGSVSEERAKLYMAELLLALEHLHGQGIVYRDLKPENVLLNGDGHVKLTDFGLSRFSARREVSTTLVLEETEAASSETPSPHSDDASAPTSPQVGANAITHSFCGTEQYMAPEVLLQKGHSAAVDFWSLGILFSELLTGKHPFRGPTHYGTLKNIVSPIVPPATIGLVSRSAGELMLGLLTKNPKDRLGSGGMAAVKGHAFFRGLDWTAVFEKRVKPAYVPRITGSEDVSNFDKVFTREAPVFSDASVTHIGGGNGDPPPSKPSGGLFGFLKKETSQRQNSRITSTDDAQFRKFSYVSPEFLP